LRATILFEGIGWGRIGVATAHTAGTGAHAADAERPCVREFLHNLGACNVELGRIDLPGVTRSDVAKSLGIELTRKRAPTELLDRIGDDLSTLVVEFESGVKVLIDEHLESFEEAENCFLPDLAAAADAILLWTHVEQGVANQLFLADQEAGSLRAANVLAAAE